MTIFLCGFMGCGKSTVGRILANLLGVGYVDMDNYIEETENMTIAEIFEKKGEQHFRMLETKAIEILSQKQMVIACGGGAMLNDKNAEIANKAGVVIFLDVPFNICYKRISGDSNRPLVVNNTVEWLENLYNKRYPIYKANSSISVTTSGTPNEVARNIFELLTNNRG
ncbi:MAG: shikimate kinase [Clostridiales bacterium]|nr:shikimate kinase [Clostridiales bacterium]